MRRREHGGAMLLTLIVLSALATIAMLTVLVVQGGTKTASTHRFHNLALYAAESGGAAAMDFLRNQLDPATGYSTLVNPYNTAPLSPAGIIGNNKPPGDPANPFSADMQAWYQVTILNNRTDGGFAAGDDLDSQVHIIVTGYGPDGSMATLEWEIRADADGTAPFALPASRSFTLIGWHQTL